MYRWLCFVHCDSSVGKQDEFKCPHSLRSALLEIINSSENHLKKYGSSNLLRTFFKKTTEFFFYLIFTFDGHIPQRFEDINEEFDVVPPTQIHTLCTDEDRRGPVTTLDRDGWVQAHLKQEVPDNKKMHCHL